MRRTRRSTRLAAALTATDIRIGSHPAFVRVVVEFTGGGIEPRHTFATDPNPFGGRSAVEVTKRGLDCDAAPESAHGVEARLAETALVREPEVRARMRSSRPRRSDGRCEAV